jgi:hypothetical protein
MDYPPEMWDIYLPGKPAPGKGKTRLPEKKPEVYPFKEANPVAVYLEEITVLVDI